LSESTPQYNELNYQRPDPKGLCILQEIGAWYQKTRQACSDTTPASELTNNREVLLTRRGNTI
jgi:hypothetical protein